MKTKITCFIACAVVATAFAPRALAADEAKASSQQSRFSSCAHESKGLRGDDHQNFMSECLKGHDAEAQAIKRDGASARAASAEPSLQQSKMKVCNDEARSKNLHGDERRAFMSSCLKG